MVQGRQRETWNHTSQLLAMLYNAHRGPKARMLRPADFHPFTGRERPLPKIKDLRLLKHVFVDR